MTGVFAADREAVVERPPGTPFSSPRTSRTRRRGPRSDAATLRRGRTRRDVDYSSPLDGLGEARSIPSIDFSSFTIDHANIRGFTGHRAELEAHITLNGDKPHMIAINETFLNREVEQVDLSGYELVSRRDRQDESGWGGIALFALPIVAPYVTLLEHSSVFERSWHVIHSDVGSVLLCVWYRPPAVGEVESIRSFRLEWERLSPRHVGTIVIGDLNVHHKRWLVHSASVSVEGSLLYKFWCDYGFKQGVRKPTREKHLLDLVLTDLEESSKATVLPRIADHNVVRSQFALRVPEAEPRNREVFLYKSADWAELRRELRYFDWSWIDHCCVDDACERLMTVLLNNIRKHIPTTMISERTTTHPWLNNRCLEAIAAKRDAEGTDLFQDAARKCSDVLFEELCAYNGRVRNRLRKLPRGSKAWWRLSRQLADRRTVASSIPALKHESGEWALTADAKANLLADTFAKKSVLPGEVLNEYSYVSSPHFCARFLAVRVRNVASALRKLKVDSGTGANGVSARVLKICASELAVPLAKLGRNILRQQRWPEAWILHWIVALYKRRSVFIPDNYRGVHLTAQISKVVERVFAEFFTPRLQEVAFGRNQFAYRKAHGARDAVAFYLLSWISSLNYGFKVAIYCSDVSGAFDRVSVDVLLRKLQSMGLQRDMLGVIRSWLRDRPAFVVVAGKSSTEMKLSNTVFQGTVWGPSLWNTFFGDSACVLEWEGYVVVVFADDYNAFKNYPSHVSNALILSNLRDAQEKLHQWGRANCVTFDAGKEHFAVLSLTDPCGDAFRMLGIQIDAKLQMGIAIRECAQEGSWKLRTLMRTRHVHSTPELVLLFKSHILSYLEYRTPGVYHAAISVLEPIDRVLQSFLRQISVSEIDALMAFNLAPLCSRRDIAMLGIVHRAVLGRGPPHFSQWFSTESEQEFRRSVRQTRNSVRPLKCLPPGRGLAIFKRSAFGLIDVYNLLPNRIVSCDDVKGFQGALSELMRQVASTGNPHWQSLFSPRFLSYIHPLRDIRC